ncbi:hypothetical protein D3C80_1036260 [compost metagenome]
MDIGLEWEIHHTILIEYFRDFILQYKSIVSNLALEEGFYFFIGKVEKVTCIIPDEPVLINGSTETTQLAFFFQKNEIIILDQIGKHQSGNATTDNQILAVIHAHFLSSFINLMEPWHMVIKNLIKL